jgi:hypothetical protein
MATEAQTATSPKVKAPVDPKAAAKAAAKGSKKVEAKATDKAPAKKDAKAPAKEVKGKDKAAPKKDAAKSEKPAKEAKAKAEKPAKEKAPAKKVELDAFGFRKGSKKSQAAKLYSTKKGATLAEVKEATGSSQLNLLKELEEKGHKVEKEKVAGTGKKQVTRYKVTSVVKDAK